MPGAFASSFTQWPSRMYGSVVTLLIDEAVCLSPVASCLMPHAPGPVEEDVLRYVSVPARTHRERKMGTDLTGSVVRCMQDRRSALRGDCACSRGAGGKRLGSYWLQWEDISGCGINFRQVSQDYAGIVDKAVRRSNPNDSVKFCVFLFFELTFLFPLT